MEIAAFAAIRQPVHLSIAGEPVEVPVRSAGDWIASLDTDVPLYEVLSERDARRINALMYDQDSGLDHDMLSQAWKLALSEQSGLPWYVAVRLIQALVAAHPSISGELALRNIDVLTDPLDLVLGAILALVDRGYDKKAKEKTQRDLWAIPPSEIAKGGWSAEEESAAFFAAMGKQTAGSASSA